MQLPVGARVAKMDLIDHATACTVEGTTKEIGEARDFFMDEVNRGLPGVYIE